MVKRISGILKEFTSVAESQSQLDWAVHEAARDGDISQIESLARKGADLNSTDRSGYAPLHWVAAYGDRLVAAVLIRAGADLYQKGPDGKNALEIANKHGREDMKESMLSALSIPHARRVKGLARLTQVQKRP